MTGNKKKKKGKERRRGLLERHEGGRDSGRWFFSSTCRCAEERKTLRWRRRHRRRGGHQQTSAAPKLPGPTSAGGLWRLLATLDAAGSLAVRVNGGCLEIFFLPPASRYTSNETPSPSPSSSSSSSSSLTAIHLFVFHLSSSSSFPPANHPLHNLLPCRRSPLPDLPVSLSPPAATCIRPPPQSLLFRFWPPPSLRA